ncbi:ribbon-helix-helix protein, CopG family [Azospirillum sp. sgz301742]
MAKAQPTSVTLAPEVKEALAKAAKDDDRSVSSLVERVLKAWLVERGYLPKPE